MSEYWIDITYDGLDLAVLCDDEQYVEICAGSDGTEITHIFTECVRELIFSAAHEKAKELQKQAREDELEDRAIAMAEDRAVELEMA